MYSSRIINLMAVPMRFRMTDNAAKVLVVKCMEMQYDNNIKMDLINRVPSKIFIIESR